MSRKQMDRRNRHWNLGVSSTSMALQLKPLQSSSSSLVQWSDDRSLLPFTAFHFQLPTFPLSTLLNLPSPPRTPSTLCSASQPSTHPPPILRPPSTLDPPPRTSSTFHFHFHPPLFSVLLSVRRDGVLAAQAARAHAERLTAQCAALAAGYLTNHRLSDGRLHW